MEKTTFKDLTVLLIKLVDKINDYVEDHHRRSAVAAYYIAKEMNLSPKELRDVVIATSIHDLGVLTLAERDIAMSEDDSQSQPHCDLGYEMLVDFKPYKDIAQIIKYHHTHFFQGEHIVDFNKGSYITHLAHRIDTMIAPNLDILVQTDRIIDRISSQAGSVFDIDVNDAFLEVSSKSDFWNNIVNMSVEELFNQLDCDDNSEIDLDTMNGFVKTLNKIVDLRN